MAKLPDEVLTVRIPPALKRDLKRLAAQDKRTISNLVEVILSQALEARQSRIRQMETEQATA